MPDNGLDQNSMAAIGFGCASLGSRVGAKEGRAALERAHAAGIVWFDVAPSYGDGAAETILGEFAAAHPGTVRVVTKVGLAAPAAGWKALVRPLARRLVGSVPSLRRFATRARSVEQIALTPAGITESVERSLRALRTERLDALMLHDVSSDTVDRDDILTTLQSLRDAGKVAACGVASSLDAAKRAAQLPETYSLLQFAHNPFEPNGLAPWLAGWRGPGRWVVTHSALGAFGAMPALTAMIEAGGPARDRLWDAAYGGSPSAMAADFLTDYALATNRDGICLFSAMKPSHLEALRARAGRPLDTAALLRLGAAIARLPGAPAK